MASLKLQCYWHFRSQTLLVMSGQIRKRGCSKTKSPISIHIWVFGEVHHHRFSSSDHYESPPALGRSAGTHLHWQTGTAPILASLNANTQLCRMSDVGELQLVMMVYGSHWPKIPLQLCWLPNIAMILRVNQKSVAAGRNLESIFIQSKLLGQSLGVHLVSNETTWNTFMTHCGTWCRIWNHTVGPLAPSSIDPRSQHFQHQKRRLVALGDTVDGKTPAKSWLPHDWNISKKWCKIMECINLARWLSTVSQLHWVWSQGSPADTPIWLQACTCAMGGGWRTSTAGSKSSTMLDERINQFLGLLSPGSVKYGRSQPNMPFSYPLQSSTLTWFHGWTSHWWQRSNIRPEMTFRTWK